MTTSSALPFASAAILGAGLMGRLLGVSLARAGCRVGLYDAGGADGSGAAARVAAAMLAPLAESTVAPPAIVRMGRHALRRWPELLAPLARPVFLQREGTLMVWHRQDAAEAARIEQWLQRTARSLPGLPAPQLLDAPAIAALEPALDRRFPRALYLPDEGQLDNRALLDALLQTLAADPRVELHWQAPRGPDDFKPGSRGQPDWVIDCRGLGAHPDWPALRGVRGEVIRVQAPEVTLKRPLRLVHPRYPLYIAPKPDQLFVIGATEIESDDRSPVSVRSALELLSAAYTVHSGFAEGRIVEMATQCRPALPDNRPMIRMPRSRLLQINGLYRHGFMIAPALLDVAMQWLAEGRSALAGEFELEVQDR